jgi:glycosyltransferase involved in cell wall biosynthesis
LVDAAGRSDEDRAAALRSRGVAVSLVKLDDEPGRPARSRFRRIVSPSVDATYPEIRAAASVGAAVRDFAPQAVFVYHFEALAATVGLGVPRLAAVGDPAHLPLYYRWRERWPGFDAARTLPRTLAAMRARRLAMRELMVPCAKTGAFAAHHAAWFRSAIVSGCEYLRTPVPWVSEEHHPHPPVGLPRILLLGHLKGVVTRSGLGVLARMLPALDDRWGPDGYEIRIVGGYGVDRRLARELDHPAVTFAGHTLAPGDEITAAHVFLVPNSIDLGVRVRIITAAAYGAAIVSHRANASGIPELESGSNCLLGDGPERLVEAATRVVADVDLSARIRSGARTTYERCFSPAVAGEAIALRLEEIALR